MDTPDIFKVMRSASPSFLAHVLPPTRVHYVLNSLLDRCVSGLLSLHNYRADALHFAGQKFELVHQYSTTVLAQRCCEIKLVCGHFGNRCPEHAASALGSPDVA